MTFPPNDMMHLLLAIAAGEKLDVADGVLRVTLPTRDGEKVIEDVVDEYAGLEERGWITSGDSPEATERGRYALERWLKANYGISVKAGTIRMGVFK